MSVTRVCPLRQELNLLTRGKKSQSTVSVLAAVRPGPQEGAGPRGGRCSLEPVLGLGLPAAELVL